MSDLVSIAIPSYNSGKYIADTLESLLKQTYQNIEIIISDNSSTDNTKIIVKKFCERDHRVKYFENEENIGYTKNISIAVGKTSGNFVAIYHADDIYSSTIIERQYNLLINNQSLKAVFTQLKFFYSDENVIKKKNYKFLYKYNLEKKDNALIGDLNNILPIFLMQENFIPCPSLMIRKNELSQNLFDDDFPTNEDLNAWLKILKSGSKIGLIMEPLFSYRVHKDQGSVAIKNNLGLDVKYQCLDTFIEKNPEIKFSNEVLCKYKKNKALSYLRAAFRSIDLGNHQLALSLLNKSKAEYKSNIFTKVGLAQNFLKTCYTLNKMLQYLREK